MLFVRKLGHLVLGFFNSQTLVDSSIEVTLQNVDTRGGFGNKLLNIYYHSAEMNITLTEAQWNLAYVGSLVGTTTTKFYEVKTTVGAKQGFPATGETGLIYVDLEKGTAWKWEVSAYVSTPWVETIKSDMIPKIVHLTLTAKLAGENGSKTGIIGSVEIDVPKAALDGNFTISMTADGVSNTPLKARALETIVDNKGVYATIKETLFP